MLSNTEQLVHTTVRIETVDSMNIVRSGTGFYFRAARIDNLQVPCIITNKHVIEGRHQGKIHFTLQKGSEDVPDYGNFRSLIIHNFENNWVKHPDPDVDLAAYPLAFAFREIEKSGQRVFYRGFDTEIIADQTLVESLEVTDEIVMVGYPNGLWDEKHNLPIVRKGIIATLPAINFNGKKQFVIDCACIPGSSGSPVVLFNRGAYTEGNIIKFGARISLLGILFAGPQINVNGAIQVVPIPTTVNQIISQTPIMINLGYCIKASELTWFDAYFRKRLEDEKGSTALPEGNDTNI